MRIRQVKPEFWRDEKLAGLALEHRLIYVGLWQEADDAGWLRWNPTEISADLFPYGTGDRVMVEAAGQALGEARCMRIYKCGHAVIPKLPTNQHLAGLTHRVYTIRDEHARCGSNRARPRGSARVPANGRGSPPWLGQVRSGQVSSTRAGAQDPPTNGTAESYLRFVNNKDPLLRDDARKHLTAMGVDWQSADTTKETP